MELIIFLGFLLVVVVVVGFFYLVVQDWLVGCLMRPVEWVFDAFLFRPLGAIYRRVRGRPAPPRHGAGAPRPPGVHVERPWLGLVPASNAASPDGVDGTKVHWPDRGSAPVLGPFPGDGDDHQVFRATMLAVGEIRDGRKTSADRREGAWLVVTRSRLAVVTNGPTGPEVVTVPFGWIHKAGCFPGDGRPTVTFWLVDTGGRGGAPSAGGGRDMRVVVCFDDADLARSAFVVVTTRVVQLWREGRHGVDAASDGRFALDAGDLAALDAVVAQASGPVDDLIVRFGPAVPVERYWSA